MEILIILALIIGVIKGMCSVPSSPGTVYAVSVNKLDIKSAENTLRSTGCTAKEAKIAIQKALAMKPATTRDLIAMAFSQMEL